MVLNPLKQAGKKSLKDQTEDLFPEEIVQEAPVTSPVDAQPSGFVQGAKEFALDATPVVGEIRAAKRIYEALSKGNLLDAGVETLGLGLGLIPGVGDLAAKGVRSAYKGSKKLFNNYIPEKTQKAYKLFVKGDDDKLYPLFVNATKEVPQDKWLKADFPSAAFKAENGKTYVPSKGAKRKKNKYYDADGIEITKKEYDSLGPNQKEFATFVKGEEQKGTGVSIKIPDEATRKKLIDEEYITEKAGRTKEAPYGKVTAVAARPGWHASQKPVATHIGPEDLKITPQERIKLLKAGINPEAIMRRKGQFSVKRRAEDHVFAEIEMANDINYQDALMKSGKTDINNYVPRGGSYKYQDGQADSDMWVVGGDLKITKVLTREETKRLQNQFGVQDLPYRDEVEAILGKKFNKGGIVGEKNMFKGVDDYQYAGMGEEMNRGGVIPMNTDRQMNMAFMEEGGLQDDGANLDPVSGNEVPSGSMDQEVRDDVPAMLSEGEYVVPADVVRFHGVKLFEDLRMEAKMGMGRMESEGRIGGEPVGEPMEDELPFDVSELETVEEPVRGMAEGGPIFTYNPNKRYGGFNPSAPQGYEMKTFTNPATGRSIVIPFFNGQPMSVIPEGFILASDQAAAQQTTAQPQMQQQRRRSGDSPFGQPDAPTQRGFDAFTTEDWNNYVTQADGQLAAFTANIPILGTLQRLSESSAKAYAEKALETGKHPATGVDLTTAEKTALQSVLNSSITERKSILESIGDLFKGEPDQNMSPRPDYAKPSLDPYNEAAARLAQEQQLPNSNNIQNISGTDEITASPAVATGNDVQPFGLVKPNPNELWRESGIAVDNLSPEEIMQLRQQEGGSTLEELEAIANLNPLVQAMDAVNYEGDRRAVLAIAEHEGTRENLIENNMNYSHANFKKLFGEEKYQQAKGLLRPALTSGKIRNIPRENHEALFNIAYGDVNGNKGGDDGFRFRGRGYIQITGRENYRNVGEQIGVDLENMSEQELNTWFSDKNNSAKASVAFFSTGNPENLQPKGLNLALSKVGGTNNERKIATYNNRNFYPTIPMITQLEKYSTIDALPSARPSLSGAAFAGEGPEISPTPSFVEGMDAVPQAGAAPTTYVPPSGGTGVQDVAPPVAKTEPYTTDAAGFAGDIPPPETSNRYMLERIPEGMGLGPDAYKDPSVTPSFVTAMNQVPQAGAGIGKPLNAIPWLEGGNKPLNIIPDQFYQPVTPQGTAGLLPQANVPTNMSDQYKTGAYFTPQGYSGYLPTSSDSLYGEGRSQDPQPSYRPTYTSPTPRRFKPITEKFGVSGYDPDMAMDREQRELNPYNIGAAGEFTVQPSYGGTVTGQDTDRFISRRDSVPLNINETIDANMRSATPIVGRGVNYGGRTPDFENLDTQTEQVFMPSYGTDEFEKARRSRPVIEETSRKDKVAVEKSDVNTAVQDAMGKDEFGRYTDIRKEQRRIGAGLSEGDKVKELQREASIRYNINRAKEWGIDPSKMKKEYFDAKGNFKPPKNAPKEILDLKATGISGTGIKVKGHHSPPSKKDPIIPSIVTKPTDKIGNIIKKGKNNNKANAKKETTQAKIDDRVKKAKESIKKGTSIKGFKSGGLVKRRATKKKNT